MLFSMKPSFHIIILHFFSHYPLLLIFVIFIHLNSHLNHLILLAFHLRLEHMIIPFLIQSMSHHTQRALLLILLGILQSQTLPFQILHLTKQYLLTPLHLYHLLHYKKVIFESLADPSDLLHTFMIIIVT